MVEIEEVEQVLSGERDADADAIEKVIPMIDRPSAVAHLEALVKKIRRDASALERVEASRAKMDGVEISEETAPSSAPALTAVPAPAAVPAAVAPFIIPSQHYTTIDKYMFDAGGYNSATVSIYVALPNVGSIPRDSITCDFTPSSFDLIVRDLGGKSYRLVNDNLENDIVPDKSKILVKADKIVLKLGKKKSEYGSYDHWSQLTAKKDKKKKAADAANPAAGIMDLMKQMYDEGDDNMKKMIGETMQKQREGKLGADGGMGGLGDMGMGDMGI
uniref:Calcyclin-binding protein n=1 Tax=Minutocellus polymorphus TaxID=265543 RepID=A0A7S0FMR0_9STRA|mmetsp:Transcript_18628/g.30918  ORF Transcript_18628/g.30918 Transcript_18628/m.30918 type:complete len:274 (+) Transcript_18628:101-922(+)